MRHAIGRPGHTIRVVVDDFGFVNQDDLVAQIRSGEVAIDIGSEDLPSGARLSEDGTHVVGPLVDDVTWFAIQAERNSRLAASDWTQLPDSPLGEATRREWAAYRQALRDLPAAQIGVPLADVRWPVPPA